MKSRFSRRHSPLLIFSPIYTDNHSEKPSSISLLISAQGDTQSKAITHRNNVAFTIPKESILINTLITSFPLWESKKTTSRRILRMSMKRSNPSEVMRLIIYFKNSIKSNSMNRLSLHKMRLFNRLKMSIVVSKHQRKKNQNKQACRYNKSPCSPKPNRLVNSPVLINDPIYIS